MTRRPRESLPARPTDKRAFYSLPAVSASYDHLRFGGRSGARINQRELDTVGRLLDGVSAGGRVLDLGSGTGRLATYLWQLRYRVVALDYSWPMVQRTGAALASSTFEMERSTSGVTCPGHPAPPGALNVEPGTLNSLIVQGDAFTLPFADDAFDGAAALRFVFHWPDLAPLLAELRRVAAPGAPLVLDTYVWTPRALFALDARRWGGRVFTHRPAAVRALAARLGLRVEAEEHCFLCSPYVYRLLPLPVVRALERLETALPTRWLARVFWRFRR